MERKGSSVGTKLTDQTRGKKTPPLEIESGERHGRLLSEIRTRGGSTRMKNRMVQRDEFDAEEDQVSYFLGKENADTFLGSSGKPRVIGRKEKGT